MRTSKSFARLTARFLIVSLSLAALIIIPSPTGAVRTMACPGPPPLPLRVLYLMNSTIVVAQVGKTEIIPPAEGDESDPELAHLRTALEVSSTLKGEHQSVVYVNHWNYGEYKDKLTSAAEGDRFLVFLNQSEGEEGLSVGDMDFGVKQLTDDELNVYVKRIEELAYILKAGKPKDEEMVEWLVRCAEDPVTEWEGAFDLAISAVNSQADIPQESPESADGEQAAEVDASVAENTAETSEESSEDAEQTGNDESEVADENSESTEAPPDIEEFSAVNSYLTDRDYTKLLTQDQKDRLVVALINTETLSDKNYHLLELVTPLDDARLVPYLLSQLRATKDEAQYFTDSLARIVATKLNDPALIELADQLTNAEEIQAAAEVQYSEEVTGEVNASSNGRLVNAEPDPAVALAAQKRRARLNYFIAIAETTAPKAVVAQAGCDVIAP
jgi:hypothetical protein